MQQQGKPIPEVFRPLTSTDAVHAAVDTRITQRQLQAWRSSLESNRNGATNDRSTLAVGGMEDDASAASQ